MRSLLPTVLLLLAWGDPPADPPAPSAVDVVSALETALGDAIARAEDSVVAISRDKSENDETLAVRGREPVRNMAMERRLPMGRFLHDVDPFGEETLSFDYGSGVVVGSKGEILTAYHVVRGAKALH